MSDTNEPRAATAAEMSRQLVEHMREVAIYWAKTDLTRPEFAKHVATVESDRLYRITGFIHSLLVAFSGCAGGLPFGIKLQTEGSSQEDIQFFRECGENWYPNGEVLEGLRELWRTRCPE